MSASSLHRESTDSLINMWLLYMHVYPNFLSLLLYACLPYIYKLILSLLHVAVVHCTSIFPFVLCTHVSMSASGHLQKW